MAKYKGREVVLLDEIKQDSDIKFTITHPDGSNETVNEAELTFTPEEQTKINKDRADRAKDKVEAAKARQDALNKRDNPSQDNSAPRAQYVKKQIEEPEYRRLLVNSGSNPTQVDAEVKNANVERNKN